MAALCNGRALSSPAVLKRKGSSEEEALLPMGEEGRIRPRLLNKYIPFALRFLSTATLPETLCMRRTVAIILNSPLGRSLSIPLSRRLVSIERGAFKATRIKLLMAPLFCKTHCFSLRSRGQRRACAFRQKHSRAICIFQQTLAQNVPMDRLA